MGNVNGLTKVILYCICVHIDHMIAMDVQQEKLILVGRLHVQTVQKDITVPVEMVELLALLVNTVIRQDNLLLLLVRDVHKVNIVVVLELLLPVIVCLVQAQKVTLELVTLVVMNVMGVRLIVVGEVVLNLVTIIVVYMEHKLEPLHRVVLPIVRIPLNHVILVDVIKDIHLVMVKAVQRQTQSIGGILEFIQ